MKKAYINAMEAHRVTMINFKEIIKSMTIEHLELLREFLVHHKANNEKKAMSIAEFFCQSLNL